MAWRESFDDLLVDVDALDLHFLTGLVVPVGRERTDLLDEEETLAFMQSLNAVRIVLGTMLDISDDDPDGDLARPFAFSGTGGDEVVITMRSEAFDTNLILTGPGGSVVASNDDIDFGSNTNSRIRTTLSSTGEHIIWCGSWIGTETGAFELSLTRQ